MMKKSHILTTLTVVAILAIVNVAAAAQGEGQGATQGEEQQIGQQMGQRMGQFRHQMREEVRTALENRDYSAWKEAMMPPVFQYVNEGNFDSFADMHEAIQNGDTEKAEELRTQLGLPERPMPGEKGMGKGRGMRNNSQITE